MAEKRKARPRAPAKPTPPAASSEPAPEPAPPAPKPAPPRPPSTPPDAANAFFPGHKEPESPPPPPAPASPTRPEAWIKMETGPPPGRPVRADLSHLPSIRMPKVRPLPEPGRLSSRLAAPTQWAAPDARPAESSRRIAQRVGLDPDRPVTPIPPLDRPDLAQVEFIPSADGYSFVRIVFDRSTNRYAYDVIEPALAAPEAQMLAFLRDTLIRTLDASVMEGDLEQQRNHLLGAIDEAIQDHSVQADGVARDRLRYYLLREFLGYGRIDVLMNDPLIEDISCDGPRIPLYVFHRQYESIKTNVVFPSEGELDAFVVRLAQRAGKSISLAQPLLDATLPDTSRLQASMSKEVTTRGSTFTIRKFRSDPLTPPDLVKLGTLSAPMTAFLWFAVEAGVSIIFAGGTASGKTSTINAVSSFIPPAKKIVTIEDTRELNLPHENWIAGLTRTGLAGDQAGSTIDMYKLLEAALRQRPEYLIVGEVRGTEAVTLFQAIATGHATYSSLHADSAQSAVYRLENPPIRLPRIMLQALGGFSIQVQARIKDRLVRRVKEIVEIVGIDPSTGELLTNTVFQWDPATDEHRYTGKSEILERILEKKGLGLAQIEQEWDNRTLIVEWMVRRGIRKIHDVANVVSAYYSRPEVLLERARREMSETAASEDSRTLA